jgi:hypothetical protein
MPKKKKLKIGMGTAWFLAILILSALAAYMPADAVTLWLILGIAGAIVAILNIRKNEEKMFLIASGSLILIIFAMVTLFYTLIPAELANFLLGLAVAFGVAGFIVSLGLIVRLGMD